MKPAAFEYSAPETLDEALAILTEDGDDAKPLAGGQSLVPMMAFRLAVFGRLVDLGGIEALSGIRLADGELVIGAGTRQRAVERDADVARVAPLLRDATHLIGHFQIRNRGTIGGSLAHADPAAEYPAVAVALDASVEVASVRGRRRIAVDELLETAYGTSLEADELLVEVRVPVLAPGEGFAIREVTRRAGDFALAGCAVRVRLNGAGAADARVVVFGVAGRPLRLTAVEDALTQGADASALDDVIATATGALDPPGDALATGAYRRKIAGHVARNAIADALADAHERRTAA